jgi:hypothetical protein
MFVSFSLSFFLFYFTSRHNEMFQLSETFCARSTDEITIVWLFYSLNDKLMTLIYFGRKTANNKRQQSRSSRKNSRFVFTCTDCFLRLLTKEGITICEEVSNDTCRLISDLLLERVVINLNFSTIGCANRISASNWSD